MGGTRKIAGGVTAARGFLAAGVACGLKKAGKLDLALIMADRPAVAVGLFTTSRVKAHPVRDSMAKLRSGKPIRGILVNSGSANACTGPEGMSDLKGVLGDLSGLTGVPSRELLMASTGVIGQRLAVTKITAALPHLKRSLSPGGHGAAARAIMTTDTFPKEYALRVRVGRGSIVIGGMAKGAGMINPHMATMLAFLTTDARVTDRRSLAKVFREAVGRSFNRMDLDSDTSTNDTSILLAGGASGIDPFAGGGGAFAEGLEEVCIALARMIARDMEGATKLVTIRVRGAASAAQAEAAARAVAESPLVKTAIYGRDANWGRIMAALGRSGAVFNPDRVSIDINGVPLVRSGMKNPSVSEARAGKALTPREIELLIDLRQGHHAWHVWTGDLTADYIRINAAYRS